MLVEGRIALVQREGGIGGGRLYHVGLAQGLKRATDTRRWALAPGMSLGRSKYDNLAGKGRPSGVESEGAGPTASILKEPVKLSDGFASRTLASVPGFAPWRMVSAVL